MVCPSGDRHHLSANQARHRVISLMQSITLALCHTTLGLGHNAMQAQWKTVTIVSCKQTPSGRQYQLSDKQNCSDRSSTAVPFTSISFLNPESTTGSVPECYREDRVVREAREKEEKELQLLMQMEEEKMKQQQYAAEQVRKATVSSASLVCHLFNIPPLSCLYINLQ